MPKLALACFVVWCFEEVDRQLGGTWMLFFVNRTGRCVLCGSYKKLTHEHKIKASALRRVFRGNAMSVFGGDAEGDRPRLAQGPKSNHFKFLPALCEACNTERTQPADMSFDILLDLCFKAHGEGQHPSASFSDPLLTKDSPTYVGIFRYFAKVLACHIAQDGGPVPRRLTMFARSSSDRNCVWLRIELDPTFAAMSHEPDLATYAAHGGLVVYGKSNGRGISGFHSSITIGPIQFIFWHRLAGIEQWELRLFHRSYYKFLLEKISQAKENPLDEWQRSRLGL